MSRMAGKFGTVFGVIDDLVALTDCGEIENNKHKMHPL